MTVKRIRLLRHLSAATGLRSILTQLIFLLPILVALYYFGTNAAENLNRQHITSGFGFLHMRAGIFIPDSLIPYDTDSTYGRAFLVGFVNTVFMSVLCIIAATFLGFCIAFGRLSHNWLLSKLCLIYVEIFRNIPVLLVILFFYFGVLQQFLPAVRDSIALPFHIFVNQRGLYFPAWHWQGGFYGINGILLPCLLSMFAFLLFSLLRLSQRWLPFRRNSVKLAAILVSVLAVLCFWHGFVPDIPQKGRFNITGGGNFSPEFAALFLGLSFYSAALISETVRAGIEGVDKGLKEAGASLGMSGSVVARAITLPLALRIIVPPLSGQYMNIAKNTSLAVAVGYSELMRVGNTVLIQTNQSVEVVLLWVLGYLSLCLIIAVLMNRLNYKLLFAERLG